MKESGQSIVISEVIGLAGCVPVNFLRLAAETIARSAPHDWVGVKTKIAQSISHPEYRTRLIHFLDLWQERAAEVSAQAAAIALMTAARIEEERGKNQSLELVWTGPEVGVIPLRRTEQAMLQLLDAALHRILIVSYAVYNIPRICDALLRAADRGVSITIIIETPDRIEGQHAYSTLKALGESIASRCHVYLWPPENRKPDANGRLGILHVKCAVADGRRLFLSSANLTEYAFTLNMELGLLLSGSALPEQVEAHFDQMIQTSVFTRV